MKDYIIPGPGGAKSLCWFGLFALNAARALCLSVKADAHC